MAYTKQSWANGSTGGTPITAERLTYIETGIETVDLKHLEGSGSPEGVVTATVGKLYMDIGNGKLYTKASGTGNTGWVEKGAAGPAGGALTNVVEAVGAGIDNTGGTSSVTGLLNSFATVPDGGVWIIPPGTYKIDSALTLQNKSVTILAYGARFIYTSATAAIVLQGSMGTTYTVNEATITETTSTAFARGEVLPVTTMTLDSTPSGWVVGDWIKVGSDDLVPPSDSTVKSGQIMMLVAISGASITLNGHLRDTYVTNVRVAKMPGNSSGAYKMRWHGGLGYHDATTMASGSMGYSLLQVCRLVNPVVRDWHVVNATGPALSTRFTYRARVIDLTVERLLDGGVIYGYGLNDSGQETLVVGLTAERVRHAYTTAGGGSGTNIGDFGRVYGSVVVNGICHGSTQVAWDVHGDADNVSFVNCHAIDCYYGFQLRGTRQKIIGGRVHGGGYPGAIQITTAATTSLNAWGHYIGGGLALEDIKGAAFLFNSESNESANPPNVIGDVYIYSRDTSKYIIDTNCPVLVQPDGLKVAAGGTRQIIRTNGSIAMAPTYVYP